MRLFATLVPVAQPVANIVPVTAPVQVANRHGKYADKAKRREYMRILMARKRAGK